MTRRAPALPVWFGITTLVAAALLDWASASPAPRPAAERAALFEDAAGNSGLNFQHFIGATGSYYTPEIMGSGVALLDYDGDGDLDVFLLQGTVLDKAKSLKDALFAPPQTHWPGNRLFRNELIPTGKFRFLDVTEQAGVGGYGAFGMGVAAGDYNNDGHPDLFVTNFGQNILYRNNGDGTFTDVTSDAGISDDSFSASAAFLDYDRDGYLDLFVTHYNAFSVQANKKCYNYAGGREYCGPGDYAPLHNKLFHNNGRGQFADVSHKSGISAALANGLGVVCADFNGDGWLDIFVANDKTPNQLWINQGNGTFKDSALISGAAYDGNGKAKAGMGVTAADFDNDGDEDIFITDLIGESHTLYQNDGTGTFDDVTNVYGLAHTTRPFTGFGTLWFDYDNDGLLDLFLANGEISTVESLRGQPFPYGQKKQLFHNEGKTFRDISAQAGRIFQRLEVSRGAAFGDIDNDGDIDVVVTNANGPVRLLLNQAGSRNHWLEVRLQGVKVNRDAYGARIALTRRGRPLIWRRAATDGSYLSAHDPRIHFGLGTDAELRSFPPESILVFWPDGSKERWNVTRADQILTLRQGAGNVVSK